ncbi:chorismate mutase [Candidatus Margulisiibacteriota bacterium]
MLRGVRGAITVKENSKPEIIAGTKELLSEIVNCNSINLGDIASVIFTVTHDLNAEFPAVAARELGWKHTPLICTNEINVPGSLGKCIRVLLHFNSEKEQKDITSVYLNDAKNLRR